MKENVKTIKTFVNSIKEGKNGEYFYSVVFMSTDASAIIKHHNATETKINAKKGQ